MVHIIYIMHMIRCQSIIGATAYIIYTFSVSPVYIFKMSSQLLNQELFRLNSQITYLKLLLLVVLTDVF